MESNCINREVLDSYGDITVKTEECELSSATTPSYFDAQLASELTIKTEEDVEKVPVSVKEEDVPSSTQPGNSFVQVIHILDGGEEVVTSDTVPTETPADDSLNPFIFIDVKKENAVEVSTSDDGSASTTGDFFNVIDKKEEPMEFLRPSVGVFEEEGLELEHTPADSRYFRSEITSKSLPVASQLEDDIRLKEVAKNSRTFQNQIEEPTLSPEPKIYKCKYCPTMLAKSRALAHIKLAHPGIFARFYRVDKTKEKTRNTTNPNVTQIKYFKCKLCMHSFSEKESFSYHLKLYHPKYTQIRGRVRCDLCGSLHSSEEKLALHKKYIHFNFTVRKINSMYSGPIRFAEPSESSDEEIPDSPSLVKGKKITLRTLVDHNNKHLTVKNSDSVGKVTSPEDESHNDSASKDDNPSFSGENVIPSGKEHQKLKDLGNLNSEEELKTGEELEDGNSKDQEMEEGNLKDQEMEEGNLKDQEMEEGNLKDQEMEEETSEGSLDGSDSRQQDMHGQKENIDDVIEISEESFSKAEELETQCDKCEYRGKNKLDLLEHIRKTHLKRNKNDFDTNLVGKGEGLNFFCDACGFEGNTLEELINHTRDVHKGRDFGVGKSGNKRMCLKFTCGLCGYICPTKEMAELHVLMSHQSETCETSERFKCEQCDFETDTQKSFSDHVVRDHCPFKCDKCDYQTYTERALRLHTINQHLRAYSCKQCNHEARTQKELRVHMASHDSKLYFCDQCDYQTHTRWDLRLHRAKIHPKEYSCDECDYQAHTKGTLRSHMIKHHAKGYLCNQCDYEAITKGELKLHVTNLHEEKGYSCEHCNFKTNQQLHLTDHVNSVHLGLKKFKCSHCDYVACRNSYIVYHMETFHSDKVAEGQK